MSAATLVVFEIALSTCGCSAACMRSCASGPIAVAVTNAAGSGAPDGAAAPLAEVGANAMADALPLFAALSDSASTSLQLPLGGALALALTLGPG